MLNEANIIGNLGAHPEIRYTGGGQAVATLRVATNEKWKDKDGNKQEKTEWHRVVVWGKQAELCGEYLAAGDQVFVKGRLQTREWNDKKHPDVKHYGTEIVAERVSFLRTKRRGNEPPAPTEPPPGKPSGTSYDDDIPF